ncbi:carboxyl transferase domain-containing protein [Pseudonocardia sp. NPDC049635]|uniref:carboxyl transferase domain-containing protein n=1 Tax=Pseudonocardia sp. NPDC049635 TaxID=3155506 RepID=UPI0034036D65
MSAARPAPPQAVELLDELLDPGSFTRWDTPALHPEPVSAEYRQSLKAATAASGADESITTGDGRIRGQQVAVAVSDFGFLGGSVGVAAARRLVAAVERATRMQLPLILSPASGGTRMQEGTPAFVEMIAVARAVQAHRRAGLLAVTYLRHPTTGGAFASWGSLGSITLAEPGALVGFLGPKIYRELHGHPFPRNVQTAENLYARGVVDLVLARQELRQLLGRLLEHVAAVKHVDLVTSGARPPDIETEVDAWAAVLATRRSDRPGLRELLDRAAANVVELSGTGEGEVAAATVLCLARFGRRSCVLVGQDRAAAQRAPGPADLRVARRGMRLAEELRLPLVTVIDTSGGELSPEAENGALAGEIARCLAQTSEMTAPTVSVLLGQGCGGVALALLPADRRIAARNAWLAPLPLEGASTIVHGTPDRSAAMARALRIRSTDLLEAGTIDRVVDEDPDAADQPGAFLDRLGDAIEEELTAALIVGRSRQRDIDGL